MSDPAASARGVLLTRVVLTDQERSDIAWTLERARVEASEARSRVGQPPTPMSELLDGSSDRPSSPRLQLRS